MGIPSMCVYSQLGLVLGCISNVDDCSLCVSVYCGRTSQIESTDTFNGTDTIYQHDYTLFTSEIVIVKIPKESFSIFN